MYYMSYKLDNLWIKSENNFIPLLLVPGFLVALVANEK